MTMRKRIIKRHNALWIFIRESQHAMISQEEDSIVVLNNETEQKLNSNFLTFVNSHYG